MADEALRQARLTLLAARSCSGRARGRSVAVAGSHRCRAEIYLNVAVSGLLTGLVYGLMALGLSVIFGVVRVVNFAHGEMMTIAMYLAVVLFAAFQLDPLVMLVPIAAVLFAFGYALQARPDQSVHHPARAQPVPAAGRGRASSSSTCC